MLNGDLEQFRLEVRTMGAAYKRKSDSSALALSKFLSPQKVVGSSTPLQRNRSNHDLADRQARARLNLEYRSRVDLASQKRQCIGNDTGQEATESETGGCEDVGRVQASSWATPPLHLTEVSC